MDSKLVVVKRTLGFGAWPAIEFGDCWFPWREPHNDRGALLADDTDLNWSRRCMVSLRKPSTEEWTASCRYFDDCRTALCLSWATEILEIVCEVCRRINDMFVS